MTHGIRKAAFQPPQPAPAEPINDNPVARLEAMYRRIWTTSMRDLPFVNLALSVEAIGFRRSQPAGSTASHIDKHPLPANDPNSPESGTIGDWVGAVITPWFVNLFVLPGGGDLWSDRPSGERCHIVFPVGPLEFIADDDATAEVPAYQYCPLFAPPGQFATQAAARAAAMAALNAMFGALPAAADGPSSPVAAAGSLRPARRSFLKRAVPR